MKKQILATNVDGLLISHKAFFEHHKAWFDRAIKKTGDKSLSKWKGKENYFPGVHLAMEKLLPKATSEQRTIQTRMWYQEDVIRYIKSHPETIQNATANKLRKLKTKYTLALITTNAQNYVDDILEAAHLEDLYDIILGSHTNEEPNKAELISRFEKEYGLPKYYISGKSDDKVIEILKEKGVKVISLDDLDSL